MTTLLAASTGGHLAQLQRLWPRLRASGLDGDAVWLTFDTPQSRSSLENENVRFLRYIAPRDGVNAMRNMRTVGNLLRFHDVTSVVSTGSGIALSVLPIARAWGAQAHYIESAARSDGPSLTGRIMSKLPVHRYTQYADWADDAWRYAGSIFDDFSARATPDRSGISRVLVTLGTIPFDFSRLTKRIEEIVPPGVEIYWQLGSTLGPLSHPNAARSLPQDELRRLAEHVDVVVAHAGIGSALMTLEAGKAPVLIPRSQDHREHIDGHQTLIAGELARRGLAITSDADRLTWEDIKVAAAIRVSPSPRSATTPFPLVGATDVVTAPLVAGA